MGRNLTITIAAIFSLAIAGCASEETPQAIEPTPIPKIAKKVANSGSILQKSSDTC